MGYIFGMARAPTMDRLVLIKKVTPSGVQRIRIVREVAPRWRELGCLMCINPHRLQAIAMNRSGIEDCVWDVFLIWLEHHQQGSYPVTWEGLSELFDDLNIVRTN